MSTAIPGAISGAFLHQSTRFKHESFDAAAKRVVGLSFFRNMLMEDSIEQVYDLVDSLPGYTLMCHVTSPMGHGVSFMFRRNDV